MPDCAHEIAEYYALPVELLQAVQHVESGERGQRVGKVGPNRNGTYDLGAMQINTWWLDHLRHLGIDAQELLENECTNIAVGAWILHQNLHRYGALEPALPAYNTGKPATTAGRKYAQRVLSLMEAPHEEHCSSKNTRNRPPGSHKHRMHSSLPRPAWFSQWAQ